MLSVATGNDFRKFSTTPLYLPLFFIEVFMFYGLFPNYYNSIFLCLTQQFPLSSLSLSTLPPILRFSHSAWLSLLIGTRWSASKHTETTGLGQIPREHYHSTCTAWQAPDEADWTQSFIPALVWWSSLIWSHFSNLLDGGRGFQSHHIWNTPVLPVVHKLSHFLCSQTLYLYTGGEEKLCST